MSKYRGLVRIVCVYVMEAHAKDQWPIGDQSCIYQHRTLEDRISAAKKFQLEFQYQPEMYVDTMENTFNNLYCVWPERGFVVSTKGGGGGRGRGGGGGGGGGGRGGRGGGGRGGGEKEGEKKEEKLVEYISDPQLDGSINWEIGISEWLQKHFGY